MLSECSTSDQLAVRQKCEWQAAKHPSISHLNQHSRKSSACQLVTLTFVCTLSKHSAGSPASSVYAKLNSKRVCSALNFLFRGKMKELNLSFIIIKAYWVCMLFSQLFALCTVTLALTWELLTSTAVLAISHKALRTQGGSSTVVFVEHLGHNGWLIFRHGALFISPFINSLWIAAHTPFLVSCKGSSNPIFCWCFTVLWCLVQYWACSRPKVRAGVIVIQLPRGRGCILCDGEVISAGLFSYFIQLPPITENNLRGSSCCLYICRNT